MIGAERICATLKALGVDVVFGLPGTQNTVLFDAMRRSKLRSVVAVDEGGAAFMATGYARASGRIGVLTTIPGPGFLYALPGVAEAREDSAPLLWITLRQPEDGQAFPLQRLDLPAIAAPLVKRHVFVERPDHLAAAIRSACQEALAGEPGPVLVEVASRLLLEPADASEATPADRMEPSWCDPEPLLQRLRAARRPVIFAGQGAQAAADEVRRLAHAWRVPVVFTSSGRGVLPDRDPLACVHDFSFAFGEALPSLIERADLVFALGCKFTHNGSAAGRLRLPLERLVRVDTSADVLRANYPAGLAICASVGEVVDAVLGARLPAAGWSTDEIAEIRSRFERERVTPIAHEPTLVADGARRSVRYVFDAMAEIFDGQIVYTADAGLHQGLTRRYASVASPRGLLCPNDFQSMGFGLAGAIGAATARPGATVVACVGDGALALSLGELLTAVREQLSIVVIVFNDGGYGLIRRQQLMNFGQEAGVALSLIDYGALAQAVGCSCFHLGGAPLRETLQTVADTPGVRLLELAFDDAPSLARTAAVRTVRSTVGRVVPSALVRLLKRSR